MVLVCGDDEVNESKLQNHFGLNIRPAHSEELAEITGADAGSIGPRCPEQRYRRFCRSLIERRK
ncbi:MAG: hypothetical protein IPG99_13995 [Ignavibacteria bacterium]|nr:hypothetical protein [Ignavibacteria bacterium]